MKIKDAFLLKLPLPLLRLARLTMPLRLRVNDIVSLFIMSLFALIFLPFRSWITQSLPFLAVLFALNIYLLPGMALATLIAKDETWIERLPLGMILSQVLLSIPGVIVLNLHLNMRIHLGVFIGISIVALGMTFILLKRREDALSEHSQDSLPIPLLIVLAIGASALFFISKHMPLIGDDWVAMPWFWQFQTADHIMATYPYHGIEIPTNVRQEFGVLALNVALVNYIAGLEPITFYIIFRPFVVIIASVAIFLLARGIFQKRIAAGFVTSIWMLLMLSTLSKGGSGYNLIVRILQDKFYLLFLVLPVGLGLLLNYFHNNERRDLFLFGLTSWAAGTTHPIGPVLIGLPAAAFGFIHLIAEHNRKTFFRLLLVGVLVAIGMTLPLLQYIGAQESSLAFSIGGSGVIDPNYVNRVRLVTRAYRLWFLEGGRYILHPAIILKREMLISLIGFPFLLWGIRKSISARLIFAAFFLVTPLLYFPPTAMLIGRLVTPWLLWRVAWVPELASWMILAGGVWIIVETLSRLISTKLDYIVQLSVLFTLTILFYPSLRTSHSFANDLWKNPDLSGCLSPSPLFKRLGNILHSDTVVLSNRTLNFCIPAYSPWAKVVEYRGVSTLSRFPEERRDEAWQRLMDVAFYSTAKFVNDDLKSIIQRYNIQYVLIEQNRLLDLQMAHLKHWFTLVDQVEGYKLYKVNPNPPFSDVVEGNSALLKGDWNTAKKHYTSALSHSDMDERLLAHVGLAQVSMNLGQVEEAIRYLEQAISIQPSEGITHLLLADTYLSANRLNDAIREYEKVISLIPASPTILVRLGDAYRIYGDHDKARALYEQAASLQAESNTGLYFTFLGQYYSNAKWYDEAFSAFRQAMHLSPASIEPLVSIGNNFLTQGDLTKAEETFYNIRKIDNWNSLASIGLGQVYSKLNESDRAIQQFQEGIQLDPSNTIINVLLASEVKTFQGLDQAIEVITHSLSYELNLPSAIQVLADLYVENNHIEEALQLYDIAISGDPLSIGTYLISIAKAYSRAGNYESTIDAYQQAERLGGSLLSVYLGLAPLYQNQGLYDQALGMYYNAIREAPFTAATHAALGNSFRSLARWDQAIDEFLTAISREPASPIGYIALANAYRVLEIYPQAIELYHQAVSLQPDIIDSYLGLGQLYFGMGDIKSAIEQYEKALSVDPANLDAYNALSKVYLSLGQIENAIAVLTKALQMLPNDPTIYDSLAEIEIIRGNENEAINWLKKGIEANPDMGLGYKNLADEYYRIGNLGQAVELYRSALERDPQLESAYSQLVSIYKRNKQYDAAYQIYQLWKKHLPHSISPYLGLGDLYKEQGLFNKAEAIYREALEFPAATASVYLSLSNLMKLQQKWDEVLKILEQATLALPYSADAQKNLADFYLQRGYVEKARSAYQKAIDLNPALVSAYVGLSQIATYSGDIEDAKQILEDALKTNPTSIDALTSMAAFLESQGEYARAETLFRKALQLAPNNIQAYINLGLFYQRQKNFEEAISTLIRALSIPPVTSGVYIALANTYNSLGQSEQAIRWITKGITLNPNDPSLYLTLANIHQSRSEWALAIDALEDALDIQPSNTAVYLSLGNIYKTLGQNDRAERAYQTACSFDPNLIECYMALGNLYASRGLWDKAVHEFQIASQIAPMDANAYIRLGQTYQTMGLTSSARLIFNISVERSLDRQTALLARAAYYKANGNWHAAERDYKEAWEMNPKNQTAGQQLSQFYLQRGEWQKALNVLKALAAQANASAQNFIDLGNFYLLRADWNAAIDAFHRAIECDKTALGAYTGIAKIFQLQGKSDQAIRILRSALEANPANAQAYINLGDAYLSRLDFQNAQLFYQNALKLDPRNVTAFTRLDNLVLKMGGLGLDLSPLKNQAETTPSAGLYIALAYQFQARGDWQTASDYLHKAVDLEPYNSLAWLSLGNYYRSLQEWDIALEYLTRALRYSPNSTTILSSIGAVQNALGQTELAMNTYSKAIDIDRSQISNYVSLANIQASLGMSDTAKKTLIEGLRIVPLGGLDVASQALLDGYTNLSLIYANEGDIESALDIIHTGLKIAPGASSLYVSLGGVYGGLVLEAKAELDAAEANFQWATSQYISASTDAQRAAASVALDQTEVIYLEAKQRLEELESNLQVNVAQASSAYQQALKYQPDNINAYIGLGRMSNASGDTEQAIEYYKRAIDLNPTSPLALNNLANYYLDLDRPYDALPLLNKALNYSPSNLGTLYGLFRAYKSFEDFNVSQAIAPIRYGHFWLANYVNLFRTFEKNNPLR